MRTKAIPIEKVIPMTGLKSVNKTQLLIGAAALAGVFFLYKHNQSTAAQAQSAQSTAADTGSYFTPPTIISGGVSSGSSDTNSSSGSGSGGMDTMAMLAALGFINKSTQNTANAANAATASYNSNIQAALQANHDALAKLQADNKAALDAALNPPVDPIAKAAADLAAQQEANNFTLAQGALDLQAKTLAAQTDIALATDQTNRLSILGNAAALGLASSRPAHDGDVVLGYTLNVTDSSGQALTVNATKSDINPAGDYVNKTVSNLPSIIKAITSAGAAPTTTGNSSTTTITTNSNPSQAVGVGNNMANSVPIDYSAIAAAGYGIGI